MKRMRKVFILLQHSNNNCVQTNQKFQCVWFQVFDTAVVGGRGGLWGGGGLLGEEGGACCCLGGVLFGEEGGGGLFFSFPFFSPLKCLLFLFFGVLLLSFSSFSFSRGWFLFQRRKVGVGGGGGGRGVWWVVCTDYTASPLLPSTNPHHDRWATLFFSQKQPLWAEPTSPTPLPQTGMGMTLSRQGVGGWKSPTHAWKCPLCLSDETENQGPPRMPTHAKTSPTHVNDPVIHARVWRIMTTPKQPGMHWQVSIFIMLKLDTIQKDKTKWKQHH